MSTLIRFGCVLLLCGTALAARAPRASAENELRACLGKANEASAEAMKQFKQTVHETIAKKRPDLEAVSALSRDVELLTVEQRAKRTAFLIASDPKRLDTTHGWGLFMRLSWNGDDETALSANDSAYGKINEQLSALQAQKRDHPKREALQAYLQKELSQTPEYAQAVAIQIKQGEALEAGLRTCGAATEAAGNVRAKAKEAR